ncbi:MAG: transcriptional regulator [Burkholderiales bacterium 28-67-8]|nr:MAG: transcriptional regulator [Burkholderiales bacterium 28-67-8]
MEKSLPSIPAKRYFTIGEVSDLCGVKPYVLRYWEQEFTQLKPMKRRGNRRYYQHHEVLLVRRIRELLYDQGFTISGARNRLIDPAARASSPDEAEFHDGPDGELPPVAEQPHISRADGPERIVATIPERREHTVEKGLLSAAQLRLELISIEALLGG